MHLRFGRHDRHQCLEDERLGVDTVGECRTCQFVDTVGDVLSECFDEDWRALVLVDAHIGGLWIEPVQFDARIVTCRCGAGVRHSGRVHGPPVGCEGAYVVVFEGGCFQFRTFEQAFETVCVTTEFTATAHIVVEWAGVCHDAALPPFVARVGEGGGFVRSQVELVRQIGEHG